MAPGALFQTQRLGFLKFSRFPRVSVAPGSRFAQISVAPGELFRIQRLGFLDLFRFSSVSVASGLCFLEFYWFPLVSVAPGARAPNAPSAPSARDSYANLCILICFYI